MEVVEKPALLGAAGPITDQATGVRLKGARTLAARAVVASIHPKMAFDLPTSGALDSKATARR